MAINKNRRIALTTGWALVMMAVIAGFCFGYALPEINQADPFNSLAENIFAKRGLYQSMLIGIIVIILLDFLVSYTLYEFFRADSKRISLTSGILRGVYTVIFGVATSYLVRNLNSNEITNEAIKTNFELFFLIWNTGLVIFGFHILLTGILMKLHQKIPKSLWYLALFAGVSYIIVHLLKLISPESEVTNMLAVVLALPMAIGELGLAIWLIVKGGKQAV